MSRPGLTKVQQSLVTDNFWNRANTLLGVHLMTGLLQGHQKAKSQEVSSWPPKYSGHKGINKRTGQNKEHE